MFSQFVGQSLELSIFAHCEFAGHIKRQNTVLHFQARAFTLGEVPQHLLINVILSELDILAEHVRALLGSWGAVESGPWQ